MGRKNKSKWGKFKGGKNYILIDLGRPMRFFIPSGKLAFPFRNTTVEKYLRQLLTKHFDAFTTSVIPNFGVWRSHTGQLVNDECKEFRVSFLGKDRIPLLLEALGEIAAVIGEACIYVEAGQYAALVYPKKS